MSAYVLSEDAFLDLDDIWEYIAKDNIDAADRWIGNLFDSFEAIGRSPGIGHKREDLTTCTVLFFSVGAYVIVYRAVHPTVEIVAVTKVRVIFRPSSGAELPMKTENIDRSSNVHAMATSRSLRLRLRLLRHCELLRQRRLHL